MPTEQTAAWADSDPLTEPTAAPYGWADTVLAIARSAIDTDASPGYKLFTSGVVTIDTPAGPFAVLTTDSPWAANAIRRALLDAGHATDADPDHSSTRVSAWTVHTPTPCPDPALEQATRDGGPTVGGQFILTGPHGSIEQQHGPAGHNDLIAHATHPHAGAVIGVCVSHGPTCWTRRAWPHRARSRHLLQAGTTTWHLTPQAEQRMRDLYIKQIHATRPTD